MDLLFVVGEEAGSDGARAARDLPATSRWLVNGEPTEGRLASAAKGSLRVEVATEGRAAHSAYPELGVSAIGAMVELLAGLEGLDWPSDPVLGETTANVGVVRGGVAANVVPPACEAEILVRLVGDDGPVRELLNAWTRGRATVEYGTCIAPQRFHTLPGFETGPVSYTSDARVLEGWGTPLLFGPGSIHVAHRPDEHVEIAELEAAVGTYAEIVRRLLEG